MRRALAAIGLVLMALATLPAGTGHAYPPEQSGLTGDRSVYSPGSSGTFTMRGCAPGEQVTFQIFRNPPVGDPVTVTADADGTAVAAGMPIPDQPGSYYVVATGDQGCTDRYDFMVASLPATGSDSRTGLLAGAVLAATGLALFVVARVRKRPATTHA